MKFYEIINAWNARQRYISPNPLDSAIIPWDIPFTGKQPINMELTFRDMSSPGTILMDIEFCDFHEWKSILVEGKKQRASVAVISSKIKTILEQFKLPPHKPDFLRTVRHEVV